MQATRKWCSVLLAISACASTRGVPPAAAQPVSREKPVQLLVYLVGPELSPAPRLKYKGKLELSVSEISLRMVPSMVRRAEIKEYIATGGPDHQPNKGAQRLAWLRFEMNEVGLREMRIAHLLESRKDVAAVFQEQVYIGYINPEPEPAGLAILVEPAELARPLAQRFTDRIETQSDGGAP